MFGPLPVFGRPRFEDMGQSASDCPRKAALHAGALNFGGQRHGSESRDVSPVDL
jgi:hypothetical protein